MGDALERSSPCRQSEREVLHSGVSVINSIVAEKRIESFGLPLLVIALCVFYMLGAAALVVEAVKSGELASAAAHAHLALVAVAQPS